MYYFSDSKSQHAQDTANEGRAAVTVHLEHSSWQGSHGLQMGGVISAVQSQNKWQEAWDLITREDRIAWCVNG
jgi:fructosamine-3-kinase